MNLLEQLENVLKISNGVLSTHKNDSGDLNEEGLRLVNEALNQKFKEIRKAGFDEGYGRDEREVLEKRDKQIAKKYNLDEGLKIDQIIESLIDNERKAIKLNPDVVEKSDIFKNAMAAKDRDIITLRQLADKERETAHEALINYTLRNEIPTILQRKGYALPENTERKKRLIDSLIEDVRSGVFVKVENGKPILKDSDGNDLRDDSLNVVSLEDRTDKFANILFDKVSAQPRVTPGIKPDSSGTPAQGGYTFTKPETLDKAYEKLVSIKDDKEYAAYTEQMNAWQSDGLI